MHGRIASGQWKGGIVLNGATWVLGAVVAAGLVLSGFWLAERPIRGLARWGSALHGVAGAVGLGLLWAGLGEDRQGFGRLAAWLLSLTLAAGLWVVVAQLRRRRPAGLVVALHAAVGVAGFVVLLAYGSMAP